MASVMPVAFYGLTVPPGDDLVPATSKLVALRITMAAINPSEAVEQDPDSSTPPRATLKIVRLHSFEDDDDDDDSDDDLDDESDSDDEEVNGGPSDPSRSKKARKAKVIAELKKALEDNDVDEDAMDTDFDSSKGSNGIISSKAKGKAKATDAASSDEDDDEDDDEDGPTEFVLCTLDPNKVWQQPLDITCGPNEEVYFQVSGTHTVYLTGNYIASRNMPGGAVDELDYDFSPDDDDDFDEDEESDELDSLDDPRITEVDTDDEEQDEAPKLVKKAPTKTPIKAEAKRGDDTAEKPNAPAQKAPTQTKGKRGAEDDADDEDNQKPESLDDIMAKSLKPGDAAAGGEPKLSKRQLKKLKNNAGKAAQPPANGDDAKKDATSEVSPSASKSEKKVQFSKDSDTGRHGEQTDGKKDNKSPGKGEKKDEKKDQKKDQKKGDNKAQKTAEDKAESKDDKKDGKSGLGNQRTVQGVIISDGKLGTGPPAKQGNTVSLRYIGKLQSNNRQFDANKSGPPFKFKIGSNEVIKGWDIGVKGMAVGGERRIIIPPELAYGNKKLDGIPPNSTLVFDLKLLSIK